MNEQYSVKIQKPLLGFKHQRKFTRGMGRMTASDSRDVSLYYQSPSLDARGVDYVVTLPTFRRPAQLIRTLESLSGQIFEERFCVVVMENDTENLQGAIAAKAYLKDSLLTGAIVLAHKRGNCHAYNAGWHIGCIIWSKRKKPPVRISSGRRRYLFSKTRPCMTLQPIRSLPRPTVRQARCRSYIHRAMC